MLSEYGRQQYTVKTWKPSLRCIECSLNARSGVESQLPEMAEGARFAVSQLAGCDTNNVKGWDSGKRGEAGWVAEGLGMGRWPESITWSRASRGGLRSRLPPWLLQTDPCLFTWVRAFQQQTGRRTVVWPHNIPSLLTTAQGRRNPLEGELLCRLSFALSSLPRARPWPPTGRRPSPLLFESARSQSVKPPS
jgi:hypothetical protein